MASCWENPENSSKRPQGYKPQLSIDEAKKKLSEAKNKMTTGQSNNQNGKTEVQGAMVEVQGAMVECNNKFSCSTIILEMMEKSPKEIAATSLSLTSGSQDLLKCKNVWIGDTGATQHSTFSASGGRNQHTCNVMMKGQVGGVTKTLTLMDFLVKLQDIRGKEYGKALLKDVQVNLMFNHNLISITKLLKDGFHLIGDSNAL